MKLFNMKNVCTNVLFSLHHLSQLPSKSNILFVISTIQGLILCTLQNNNFVIYTIKELKNLRVLFFVLMYPNINIH